MEALVSLWMREPARIVSFTVAILAILTAFGVQITTGQQEAIVGVVVAIIALLGGEVTRAKVYAPATVEDVKSMAFLEGHKEGVTTARLRTPIVQGDNVESVSGA